MNTREYLRMNYAQSENKINEIAEKIDSYYLNNGSKMHKTVDMIICKFGEITDPDYFYSAANSILLFDALPCYDWTGNFDNFLFSCLQKKLRTELTYINRDKRIQYVRDKDGNKIKDENGKYIRLKTLSLDAPVICSDEGDMGETLADGVKSDFDLEKTVFGENHINGSKVEKYLKRLSKIQRRIVELLASGYKPSEIREKLQINEKEYKNHMSGIHAYENVSILY